MRTLSEFQLIEIETQAANLRDTATKYQTDPLGTEWNCADDLAELALDASCSMETLCERLRAASSECQREQGAAA